VTVVLVSNRVADSRLDGPVEGGLASALLQAVKNCGAFWLGTRIQQSNSANSERKGPLTALATIGAGTTARVDVPAGLYDKFYKGFANSGLWPVLHSRPDLIRARDDDYAAYREVNRLLAVALTRLVRHEARIWIHDYHFMTLAEELRRLDIRVPVGFFLHTPFPTTTALPACRITATLRAPCSATTWSASRPRTTRRIFPTTCATSSHCKSATTAWSAAPARGLPVSPSGSTCRLSPRAP